MPDAFECVSGFMTALETLTLPLTSAALVVCGALFALAFV